MSKLFPPMQADRKFSGIVGVALCWVVTFFVVPFYLIPLATDGVWGSLEGTSWVEIIYQVVKAGIVISLLKEYFAEDFFFVKISLKEYIGHAALAVVLMVAAVAAQMVPMVLMGMPVGYLLNAFPVVDMAATFTPGYLAYVNPIFGTLCLTVFAPVSICGMFYFVGFAPACSKKTWLGYLCVAVVTAIPVLISRIWHWDATLTLDMYLLQLPVHLIACWSYQKTDNIWTPVIALAMLNLLASVANMILV